MRAVALRILIDHAGDSFSCPPFQKLPPVSTELGL
jgi:hypothetical protein